MSDEVWLPPPSFLPLSLPPYPLTQQEFEQWCASIGAKGCGEGAWRVHDEVCAKEQNREDVAEIWGGVLRVWGGYLLFLR